MSTARARRAAWLIAGLLSLTPALSLCRAQELLGYAPPDVTCRGKLIMRTYLIADLAVSGKGSTREAELVYAERLMSRLMDTINSDTWSAHGGRGTIDYFPLGMTLVVQQTAEVQEHIADTLQRLRRKQDAEANRPIMPRADDDEDACESDRGPKADLGSNLKSLVEKYGKACAVASEWAEAINRLLELCGIDLFASPPTERMDKLLLNSPNNREIQREWIHFWFIDQPSHLTFDRIHSGIE